MSLAVAYYDVVIVGAGPAGLMLSVCLSRWGYRIKHIDIRPVPTATGRADGLQPRSLEILKNLGLKRKIMSHDPAKVYEVAFWDPRDDDGIARTGTWPTCPRFLDARYPFSTLLHQGLIERVFLGDLNKNGTIVDRPWAVTRFENDGKDEQHPVFVDLKNLDSNVTEHVRTKYLFSGEGARSFVREQLGIKMQHRDPITHVWGVMDGVVRTNFPDIRIKCTIRSHHGSIMVIPREADMVRLYIQLASSTDKDWQPRRTPTVEEVQKAAVRILSPYEISWDRVEWYSIYPISQGIAEKYTLDQRIFLGGDAGHTHSPKAGQGMNTAFHDAINLAWKVHHVESGFADRSILSTYESERKLIAENLLEFDAQYARLFSQHQPSTSEVGSANSNHISSPSPSPSSSNNGETKNQFIETLKANLEFTNGFGIVYQPNIFNRSPNLHSTTTSLFINPPSYRCAPGRILPRANLTRVIDANIVYLENAIPFDGSFRLFIFGGTAATQSAKLTDLAHGLQRPGSFYTRFSSKAQHRHHGQHSQHSCFCSLALVLAARRAEIEMCDLPSLLRDCAAQVYADDIWDQRVPEAGAIAHAKVGLEGDGGVVVVRPDGHVGCVVGLVEGDGTVRALEEYFGGFVVGGMEGGGGWKQKQEQKQKPEGGMRARL